MITTAALAIMCYISPNPLPLRISVSGDVASIEQLKARAAKVGSIRLIAAAEDRGVSFARFEIGPNTLYRDIGGLIFNAQRSGVMFASGQAISNCSDGGIEDLGDSYAPIMVGIIGDKQAIETVKPDLAWARLEPLQLKDGRTGWRFAPGDRDEPAYKAFVKKAVQAKFPGVEIARLGPER